MILIFQIQLAIGVARCLTNYIYGGRDWRGISNGQQIAAVPLLGVSPRRHYLVNFINIADGNSPM